MKTAEKTCFTGAQLYGRPTFGGKGSLQHARECLKTGDVHVRMDRESYSTSGKYYCFFAGISLPTLRSAWQEDNHMYEILSSRRKPYFDLDFMYVSDEQEKAEYESAVSIIGELLEELHAPFEPHQLAVCSVRGKPSVGLYANRIKSSFHIIVNNGYVFNSLKDTKNFGRLILERQKKFPEAYAKFDNRVYDENRLFKLPYQTKGVDRGSRQPQIPKNRDHGLDHFLISHNLPPTVKAINVPELPVAAERTKRRSRGENCQKNRVSAGSRNDVLEEFLAHYAGKDVSSIPNGKPSWSTEYLVESIFIDHTMLYNVWFKVGSAVKRIHIGQEDDGFQMFCRWSRNWTTQMQKLPRVELQVLTPSKKTVGEVSVRKHAGTLL